MAGIGNVMVGIARISRTHAVDGGPVLGLPVDSLHRLAQLAAPAALPNSRAACATCDTRRRGIRGPVEAG